MKKLRLLKNPSKIQLQTKKNKNSPKKINKPYWNLLEKKRKKRNYKKRSKMKKIQKYKVY
jgi:hypothetical protein